MFFVDVPVNTRSFLSIDQYSHDSEYPKNLIMGYGSVVLKQASLTSKDRMPVEVWTIRDYPTRDSDSTSTAS